MIIMKKKLKKEVKEGILYICLTSDLNSAKNLLFCKRNYHCGTAVRQGHLCPFKTAFPCVGQVGLESREVCLCLLSWDITGVSHHILLRHTLVFLRQSLSA